MALASDGSVTSSIEWFDNVGNSLGNSDTLVVCPSSTTSYFVNVSYDICDGTQVIVSDDININVGTNIGIEQVVLVVVMIIPGKDKQLRRQEH